MPREEDRDRSSPGTFEGALGKAIAIRRLELGLKRNDLRDRSGLSYPYIAELENGSKRASSKALAALAGALEVSVSELIARAETLREPELSGGPTAAASSFSAPMAAPVPPPVAARGAKRSWFHAEARNEPRPPAAISEPELTEDRVREIVRDELSRLGVLSDEPGRGRRR